MIIFGTRLFGKCDQVGNLFHVRTRFFHVWFVPLIPVQSFIVLTGSEHYGGFKGVPTPMSLKSVLLGWLRGAVIVGMIFLAFSAVSLGLAFANEQDPAALVGAIFCAALVGGGILLFWLSVRFAGAGYHRALDLADQLGLPHDVVEQVYAGGTAAEPHRDDRSDQDYDDRPRDADPTYEDDERWRQ